MKGREDGNTRLSARDTQEGGEFEFLRCCTKFVPMIF